MLLKPSPQAAALELLRRRKARRSLTDYARYIEVPGAPVNEQDDEAEDFQPVETTLAKHHEIILDATQRCIAKHRGRTMLFLPPGSAKSTYATVVSTTWAMGSMPNFKAITVSYGSDLARKFGRRMRSIAKQPAFQTLFGTTLSQESAAADEWALTNGSEFMGGGILSGITGNRADFIAIDDPIKGRQEADSEATRKSTIDAYNDDVLTRLKPHGSVMMTLCMVGETPVMLADGSTRALRDIRPGIKVATYRAGILSTAKVVNWRSCGDDPVYEITTTSGITVRANERHPFLIERNGVLEWVRLRNLVPGDKALRVTGVNGEVKPVQSKDAISLLAREDSASHITTKINGPEALGRPAIWTKASEETQSSDIGMGLAYPSTTQCLSNKAVLAPSAKEGQQKAPQNIGEKSSALIIATTPEELGGCCATIATSSSAEAEAFQSLSAHGNTFATDEIVSILPVGTAEVFDVQIEGTENFIANGLVSHNTRWHEGDLAGSILPENWNGESGMIECRDGETWEVIAIPAQAERTDDLLGREVGEYIWPEWFTEDHWRPFKRIPRTWSALYQQRPAPDTGDYFRKEWIHLVESLPDRRSLRVYGGSDYAVTSNGGDYTVHAVVALDPEGKPWLLDIWRKQASSDVWVDSFCDLVLKHKPIGWAEETGQIKSGVGPFLTRAQLAKGAYVAREQFPTRGDKAIRAQSFRGLIATRGLYIHKDAPWLADLLSEMMSFPVGVHDDQVDALGLVGQLIDRMLEGQKYEEPKPLNDDDEEGIVAPQLRMRRR